MSSGVPTIDVSCSISSSSVVSFFMPGDAPEVVLALVLAALAHVGDRLLAGLGEVGPDDQAPLLAAQHLTGRRRPPPGPCAHCAARSFLPPISPAPSDSTPTPCVPAHTMPDGDVVLATAIGIEPFTGSICSRASCSSNQSTGGVTTSPASRRMMTPSASSMRGRWVTGSMPIITASEIERAGPDAEHRPTVRQVVELHEAVGDHHRVVVRQADDARAEPDVLGALDRRRRGTRPGRRCSPTPPSGARRPTPRRTRARRTTRSARGRGGT